MFRLAAFGVVGSLLWGVARGHQLGRGFDLTSLVLLVPCAVLVAAAVVHWVTHPDGIKDTWAGGSISFKHAQPHRLEWSDWALWTTHAGRIDARANMVRVEKRVLLGLIPAGTTIKSTRDFNQVEVEEQVQTVRRRRRSLIGYSYRTEASHLTLTLVLFNAAGERLVLLDVNTALEPTRASRFMQELKAQVAQLVAPSRAV